MDPDLLPLLPLAHIIDAIRSGKVSRKRHQRVIFWTVAILGFGALALLLFGGTMVLVS